MEFDMINEMEVDELKKYLRLRGLKISGRKAELVARVFAAHENNVQPVKTAAEIEIELSQEYQAKLLQVDYVVPDPYHHSLKKRYCGHYGRFYCFPHMNLKFWGWSEPNASKFKKRPLIRKIYCMV